MAKTFPTGKDIVVYVIVVVLVGGSGVDIGDIVAVLLH